MGARGGPGGCPRHLRTLSINLRRDARNVLEEPSPSRCCLPAICRQLDRGRAIEFAEDADGQNLTLTSEHQIQNARDEEEPQQQAAQRAALRSGSRECRVILRVARDDPLALCSDLLDRLTKDLRRLPRGGDRLLRTSHHREVVHDTGDYRQCQQEGDDTRSAATGGARWAHGNGLRGLENAAISLRPGVSAAE